MDKMLKSGGLHEFYSIDPQPDRTRGDGSQNPKSLVTLFMDAPYIIGIELFLVDCTRCSPFECRSCPGDRAPGGMVSATPDSGTETRAPALPTVAHVVNFGSCAKPKEEEDDDGSGVEEDVGGGEPGSCCCCA